MSPRTVRLLMALRAALARTLDTASLIMLAALAAVWYGITQVYGEGWAWLAVGLAIYVPAIFARLTFNLIRSWRSEPDGSRR